MWCRAPCRRRCLHRWWHRPPLHAGCLVEGYTCWKLWPPLLLLLLLLVMLVPKQRLLVLLTLLVRPHMV
jgi:hypothetical protein